MSDETGGQQTADDDFDRALRELTEGTAGKSRFRELSAAERAKVAAKQAKQGDKRAKARAREAKKQARRGGGGPRDWSPGSGRRRGRRAAVWVAVMAVIGGAGVFGWHQLKGKVHTTVAGLALAPRPTSQTTTPALLTPPTVFAGPPADPFSGTPADHWANGAAGIGVPAAKPAGSFTSAQVKAAYATTRKLLVAQNLDPATLRGGKPAAFESLLSLQELNQFVRGLDKKGLAKDGSPLSTRGWVASFAPGSARLVGSVVKVHGTMSARAGTANGQKVLDVDVNFRFVYVVEPPGKPREWMRVVGQVSGDDQFFRTRDPSGALQPWVGAFPGASGVKCGTTDGYLHPDYITSPPDTVQPSGPAIDPYSMQVPKGEGACWRTTGT